MTASPEIQSKSEAILSARGELAEAIAARNGAREKLELGEAAATWARETVREAEEQLVRHMQALESTRALQAQEMAERIRQGLPTSNIERTEEERRAFEAVPRSRERACVVRGHSYFAGNGDLFILP